MSDSHGNIVQTNQLLKLKSSFSTKIQPLLFHPVLLFQQKVHHCDHRFLLEDLTSKTDIKVLQYLKG